MATRKNSVAGVPGKDKTLPNVPLTLNGKTFQLAYSFNAIATAEELTGLELLGNVDLQNLNARSYRALLYSAMLVGQPDITLGEVGDLITVANLPAITVALVHAWTGSRPEVIVDKQDKNPPVEQQEENPS